MGLSNLRIGIWFSRALFAIIVIVILMVTIPFRNVWGADASPSPTFTLVGAVLKLENGEKEGKATMLLKVDGLDRTKTDYPPKPDLLRDLGVPKPPLVDVTFEAREMQVGDSSRSWLLSADIRNLPGNTSQKRYLQVRYAGLERTLDYTLTNKYDTAFSWTLKPPPSAISIRSGGAIEIGIAVGPVPASKVKLLQAALIEQSRKYPLAKAGLILCKNPIGPCESEIDLEEHSANRLWLRTKDDAYPSGQFQGSVTITASQKPEGDTINLTVYATELCRQWGGIGLIILGVVASWWVSTYSRARLTRDQVLLSAALVREKFKGLKIKLTEAPSEIDRRNTEQTSCKLDRLLEELSEDTLVSKWHLSRSLSPIAEMTPKPDEFKDFWQRMDEWALALDGLIFRGMAQAWNRLSSDPNVKSKINQTVSELDQLATGERAPQPALLTAQIEEKLKEVKSLPLPSGASPTPDTEEKERLQFEINFINWTLWIIMLVVTTVVGAYIVVLSNLGFGVWVDYLFCILWGFGLPIGGQQLLQMTSANVATTLGISVTKR